MIIITMTTTTTMTTAMSRSSAKACEWKGIGIEKRLNQSSPSWCVNTR
jgi:hypothetical protein